LLRSQGLHFSLGLFQRDTRLQTRGHAQAVKRALHLRAGPVERRPEIGLLVEQKKIRRHHADNGFIEAIHAQGLPDHVAVPVETALPETGADQQDACRGVNWILIFRKHAAEYGLDSKRLKHRRREVFAIDSFGRLAVLVRADVANVVANAAHRLEGFGSLLEREIVIGADPVELVGVIERS
jgi:hypothetical protein